MQRQNVKTFYFLNNSLFATYTLRVDFPRIYDFEGKRIYQYDARFSKAQYFLDPKALDEAKNDTLKVKLDITIAKEIYKLKKEEFFYLLQSFKVLQNKQPSYIALLKSLWE